MRTGVGLGPNLVHVLVIVHRTKELDGAATLVAMSGERDVWLSQAPSVVVQAAHIQHRFRYHRAMESNSDVVVRRKRALTGLRVLVVDDNDDTRDVLQTVLEADGAAVSTAGSSDAALMAMDRERLDVLIIDIGMPVVNGFELVSQIRSRPVERGGRVPAVALTGYISAEDRARAVDAGFQAYLTKPVDERALVDAVRLLGRNQ